MEEQFRVFRCPTCGGPSHPASGCQYSENFVVCGPCVREAWVWIVQMTNSKGRRQGRPAFYDHVNRIHPPVQIASEPGRI
jgi:hypothetical protein